MDPQFSALNSPHLRPVTPSSNSACSFLQNFRSGEVINGKIMELLSGNKYVIRVRGRDIVAESTLELKPGNIYSMRVQTTFPNFSFSILQQSEESADLELVAAKTLQKMNIPVNTVTKEIAVQLLTAKMPLTREMISFVIENYDKYFRNEKNGITDSNKILFLLFMLNKNIPVSQQSIRLVKDFFKGPEHVVKNLQTLFSQYEFKKLFNKQGGSDINKLAEELTKSASMGSAVKMSKLLPELENLFETIFNEILLLVKHKENTKSILVMLLKLMGFFQGLHVINYKAPFGDFPYFLPILLNIDDNRVLVDFLYIQRTFSDHNKENMPGFTIHLLISLNDSPPLHAMLSKQVREMLNIHFRHPINSNLDLLRDKYSHMRRVFKSFGYRVIRITDEITDTSCPEYRSRLFLPKRQLVKSINFKG